MGFWTLTASRGECLSHEWGNELWVLLPERGLWWPRVQTLFVSDLHLGKDRSLPLPLGSSEATLSRLSHLVTSLPATRVVVVGDLWHHRIGTTSELLSQVESWTQSHPDCEFTLVQGNHDVRSAPCPEGWRDAGDTAEFGEFIAVHDPDHAHLHEGRGAISGHLHPGYRVEGRGGQSLTLPCFWCRPNQVVLPAFGELTGLAKISPEGADQVAVIGADTLRWVPRIW